MKLAVAEGILRANVVPPTWPKLIVPVGVPVEVVVLLEDNAEVVVVALRTFDVG
jgi:hypothetical protein